MPFVDLPTPRPYYNVVLAAELLIINHKAKQLLTWYDRNVKFKDIIIFTRIMILAVATFLIIVIPQINVLRKGDSKNTKIIMSVIQVAIQIGVILLFVVGLGKLKKITQREECTYKID